eukprot:TRINITY_DN12342_c0_g1_i2.p1 TRINITY_DN12342_c0_g1~~TRINITY_DN12342_c0_g1_i2.p1  ORF type:complete len:574 (-),score=57.69 TRINITY_DN12342_c0_g1_i2:2153-3874(-)
MGHAARHIERLAPSSVCPPLGNIAAVRHLAGAAHPEDRAGRTFDCGANDGRWPDCAAENHHPHRRHDHTPAPLIALSPAMNLSLTSLEIAVVLLGIGFLLADLFKPCEHKSRVGFAAAAGLLIILIYSLSLDASITRYAFGHSYVMDTLALFFKRFFLLAAIFVLVMATQFTVCIRTGIVEYYCLMLFALAGMMFAASANDLAMLFVSLETITVSFYVLVSCHRQRTRSLEAGAKYLILGGLSSAVLVYGIALMYGASGTLSFQELHANSATLMDSTVFQAGLLMVLSAIGFKIATFPFQMWAPDVYEGAPAPTTAFLAVGSKAAGFVLLLRLFYCVLPDAGELWEHLMIALACITILYGNLCAIPQRNLKRLMGYSSIANAGYLLMGIAAMTKAGSTAILYYLCAYLFTVLAAFTVICHVVAETGSEDISALAGLNRRSPILAATLTLAMVSLAGIPPLAGFFGKFLLLMAVVEHGSRHFIYYGLAGVAVVGVVISIYYYMGVVRAIYWSEPPADVTPIRISLPNQLSIAVCVIAILILGLYPAPLMELAARAAKVLHLSQRTQRKIFKLVV